MGVTAEKQTDEYQFKAGQVQPIKTTDVAMELSPYSDRLGSKVPGYATETCLQRDK